MKGRLSGRVAMVSVIAASLAAIRGSAEELVSTTAAKPAEAATGPAKQPQRLSFNPSWSEGLVWRTVDDHLRLRVGAYLMYDWAGAYIDGGRETNVTLGVNWYLNKKMRMALNYVHGKVDRDACDGSVDAVQMRMQFDFQPQGLNEYRPLRTIQKPTHKMTENKNN